MAGNSSRANSTSMTAPMHCTMVPSCPCFAALASFMSFPSDASIAAAGSSTLDRRRAAYDFRQLFRDARLARLVIDQLQLVDDRRRIIGSRLHRDHARALFRRHVLVHRLVDGRLDITREQP